MNIKYALVSTNDFDKLLVQFVKKYGYPQIKRKFSVYAYNKKEDELHINYIDQRCDVKLIPANNNNKFTTPPIFIENKNLKRLFETAWMLGFKKANIGFISSVNFTIADDIQICFLSNTFADNLIEIKYSDSDSLNFTNVINIFHDNKIELIDKFHLRNFLEKKNLHKEDIFDKFGCLNSKIKKFGEAIGIDTLSNTKTIKNRIKKFSNDYSLYENWFEKITGTDINGLKGEIKQNYGFKPVLIVIPCFNSNDTIIKTLFSIESQNLSIDEKKKIEVIVVDDGSKIPVYKVLKPYLKDFNFCLRVIRLEQNNGLSTARNVGLFCSKNNFLILLDSDILIPKNYISEHLVRNQLIPHAVFVSFKKNIENGDEIASLENIKKGLISPKSIDDLRKIKQIRKNQMGIHQSSENTTIEILNDTNYFKDFGFGRVIGVFDLATMVIGHNMSLRRKTIDKAKYFSNNFNGWGLEDSYFGAKIIANGNYIIPVLSSNVYHINHSPRSGSDEIKQMEFKNNLELYNRLLEEEFE